MESNSNSNSSSSSSIEKGCSCFNSIDGGSTVSVHIIALVVAVVLVIIGISLVAI